VGSRTPRYRLHVRLSMEREDDICMRRQTTTMMETHKKNCQWKAFYAALDTLKKMLEEADAKK
jgi:hypothetical protein